MKKIYSIILISSLISASTFAQTANVETLKGNAEKEQIVKLEEAALGAMVADHYVEPRISEKIKLSAVCRSCNYGGLSSIAGGFVFLAGIGLSAFGDQSFFASISRAANERIIYAGISVGGAGALSVAGGSLLSNYGPDKEQDKISQTILQDSQVDNALNQLLEPWNIILGLSSVQQNQLKVAMKNEMVKESQEQFQKHNSATFNFHPSILDLAVQNGIIDAKYAKSAKEVGKLVFTGNNSYREVPVDFNALYNSDLAMAQELYDRLTVVKNSNVISADEKSHLTKSLENLKYQINAAQEFQAALK